MAEWRRQLCRIDVGAEQKCLNGSAGLSGARALGSTVAAALCSAGLGPRRAAGNPSSSGCALAPCSWRSRPNSDARPAQAASVVLTATRAMPDAAIADKVLPGLKPYQRPPATRRRRLLSTTVEPAKSRNGAGVSLGEGRVSPQMQVLTRTSVTTLMVSRERPKPASRRTKPSLHGLTAHRHHHEKYDGHAHQLARSEGGQGSTRVLRDLQSVCQPAGAFVPRPGLARAVNGGRSRMSDQSGAFNRAPRRCRRLVRRAPGQARSDNSVGSFETSDEVVGGSLERKGTRGRRAKEEEGCLERGVA